MEVSRDEELKEPRWQLQCSGADSRRVANPLRFCLLMLAVHFILCFWNRLGAADQESARNKVLEKISDLFPDVLAQAAKHRAVERHELGTTLQAAGSGDHFIRVLVNWHHRSWISVDGVRDIACCSKGTRPGDPLADIIFNLGMTFILSELDKCREDPPSVRWEPMRGPFLVSPGSKKRV